MGRRLVLLLVLLWLPALVGAENRPAVLLVIDDMGDRPAEGDRVVALDAPLVCSVLPHTPHAERQARACHAASKDVMLHLPMQAIEDVPLGPGGVTLDMPPEEFRDAVTDSLAAVPHVRSVNNHMGSLLTRHPGHMTWLMEVLQEEGELLFLDSRTSERTVAKDMALEAELPALERDVFLDHHRDAEAIRAQLHQLFRTARRQGTAVGIGHPYPETLDVLEQDLRQFAETYQVELVGLDELYGRRNNQH